MKQRAFIAVVILALLVWWWWPESKVSTPIPNVETSDEEVPEVVTPAPEVPQPKPAPAPTVEVPKEPSLKLTQEEVQSVRAQARYSLSSAYSALKAYYMEFGAYSTDLRGIGYRPQEEMKVKLGFLEPAREVLAEGEDPTANTTDTFFNSEDPNDPKMKYAPTAEKVNLADLARYCRERCTVSGDRFEIIAAANLDDDDTLDVWLIDDRKQLIHVSDDLAD